MSFSDIYGYSSNVDGNLEYTNPEMYLLSLPTVSYDNAGLFKSYIETRKVEEALIKDKYAKVKKEVPRPIGSGFNKTGLAWQNAAKQENSMSQAYPEPATPRNFSFGMSKRR